MQVQQHIMRGQQRAQHIGNAVLVILWIGVGTQVAVQVAVTGALLLGIGQRVGDGYKSCGTTGDVKRATV